MKLLARIIVLGALASIAACAGAPQRTDEQRYAAERYQQYATGSVGSFNYFGRFDGWRPVGNNKLIVWTSVKNAYLLTVEPPCNDLQFSNAIAFTSVVKGTVSSNIDSVRLSNERCRITEIQRFDYERMKQDEKSEKAAKE